MSHETLAEAVDHEIDLLAAPDLLMMGRMLTDQGHEWSERGHALSASYCFDQADRCLTRAQLLEMAA